MIESISLPNFDDIQIPFPFREDTKFEIFITDYFNSLENTTSYDRYGRTGQKQFGLDVFSKDKNTVIQCKNKAIGRGDDVIRKELLDDLETDFNAFNIYNKSQNLGFNKFIFTSSIKSDTQIQNACIKKSKNGITVEYWSWDRLIAQATNDVKQKYFPYLLEENDRIYSTSIVTKSIAIDKSKPILHQLYEYVQITYKEINKLPNHILAKQYPFKNDSSAYTYYKNFNLNTNNLELFNFFASLKINKQHIAFNHKALIKGVTNFDKKTKTVLNKLTNNLVYNIYNDKEHKRVDIKYFLHQKCTCIRCKLNTFNFDEGLVQLNKRETSISSRMKLAYTNYQCGNYVTSANQFFKISEDSKKKGLRLTSFICDYNLIKLRIFIKNNYWGENSQTELIEKIDKINLDTIAKQFKSSENDELVKWIKSDSFYSEARDKIQNITSNIISHYYSQLNGGWSSSNEVYELMNEYADLEMFLNNNFIVFDNFSEFNAVTKTFTEGLFASLAMNDSQNSKLKSFDDWIIHKLLIYSDSDSIIKFFNRYNLAAIKYEKTSTKNEADGFIEKINNFFDNVKIDESVKKYCENNNTRFWNKYNKLFENILTLSGLISLNDEQVNNIVIKLNSFLKTDDNLYSYRAKRMRFFIRKKGSQISRENLKQLLLTVIDNKKLHNDNIVEALADTIEKYHKYVALPLKYYNIIDKMVFDKCPSCNSKHPYSVIISIYRITKNEKQKNIIKSSIDTNLILSFDDDLFYEAVLWDIIVPDKKSLNKFIFACTPSPNKKSFKEVFGGGVDEVNLDLNRLYNLYFKFQKPLTNKQFKAFSEINNYYKWLTNMRDFDYKLFNPTWIDEYPTKYFLNEIRKHSIIKVKIIECLKKKNDPVLEKAFMNLYYKWIN